jgi:hypothetical protein
VVRWVGITLVASIAGLVSYRHLRGLLKADNEEWIVYTVGPLAIDGLMLMATLALLLTRKLPAAVPAPPSTTVDNGVDEVLERHGVTTELPIPTSPAPSGAAELPPVPPRERAPRASSSQTEAAVRAMLEDPELKTNGNSTLRRYARVTRQLRDDPQAAVDYGQEKVKADIVEQTIRPWANLERVR